LIAVCPNLLQLSLQGNAVESGTDSVKIRNAISMEIGARPHHMTRAIWKVPTTKLECLDVRGCGLFSHVGSLHNVLEDIERCQEMKFFFSCLSQVYGLRIDGANTPMPIQWENRSPADVALQLMKKHKIKASAWVGNKTKCFELLKQWDLGKDILLHGEDDFEDDGYY
jgi:hypothetical protein